MFKCMQIIYAKYCELRYVFKKVHIIKIGVFACMRVIFGVQFERQNVDKKRKLTQKLKHANSILEYFEHFCQMSS